MMIRRESKECSTDKWHITYVAEIFKSSFPLNYLYCKKKLHLKLLNIMADVNIDPDDRNRTLHCCPVAHSLCS
jgi:hypothetical protein